MRPQFPDQPSQRQQNQQTEDDQQDQDRQRVSRVNLDSADLPVSFCPVVRLAGKNIGVEFIDVAAAGLGWASGTGDVAAHGDASCCGGSVGGGVGGGVGGCAGLCEGSKRWGVNCGGFILRVGQSIGPGKYRRNVRACYCGGGGRSGQSSSFC